jgi:predicted MPP superfamily phosphohydrolase
LGAENGADSIRSAQQGISEVDGFAFGEAPRLIELGMQDWLAARLGPELAARRSKLEATKEAAVARHAAEEVFSFWHMVDVSVPNILRLTGFLGRGRANAARIQVTRNVVPIRGLPEALNGFTLLHLTDLHADISENAMRALPQALSGLSYDLCVITGDFRGRTFGPFARTVEIVREVAAAIRVPMLGVLGNHDTARILPDLEAMGIRLLMNEAVAIERGRERLWVAGVDDPHYYRTDDTSAAVSKIPAGEPVVLLAHSTERFVAAIEAGVGRMLCGHTHGGQICLPGSIPILTSTKMPRWLASGPWRHGGMHGYTSRGVGTSSVDARFNCPPEVVLHTLVPDGRL